MDMTEDKIYLYSTDTFCTEQSKDAFRVESGTVLVYIAPMKNGSPDRRILLCEVKAGGMIPALSYRDSDYREWRFLLTAKEEAELLWLHGKCTSVLQKKFSSAAGLATPGREGYEQNLAEYYNRESLKDNVFIGRGKKDEPNVKSAAYGVIKDAFHADGDQVTGSTPLYRAVAFACKAASIPLADEEKLQNLYGSDLTIGQIAHTSRFACRRILLEPKWNRSDCGTFISSIEGEPVACVPAGAGHYTIYYGGSGKQERLTEQVARMIEPTAVAVCRSLPGRKLTKQDLIRFGRESLNPRDLLLVVLLGVAGGLIGILNPTLNQKIYDDYIPLGETSQLIQICVVIAAFMVTNLFFDMVKRLSEFRIGSRIAYDMQSAVFYRVFHLPESFFHDYDSADLGQRICSVTYFARGYVSFFVVSGLAAVFSLLYLYKMFRYSAKLTWIALLILAIYGLLVFLLSIRTIRLSEQIETSKGKASAQLYQYLNGIEKIRMAGVEDRAAYEYLLPFSEKQAAETRKNHYDAASATLSGSASVLFSMVFYYLIVKQRLNISVGTFMAFNAAFGSFSATVLNLITSAAGLLQLKPLFRRFLPVLETPIEDEEDCEIPEPLQGAVSLRNVSFSYGENAPPVLRNIDLQIRPGEYVGIVGPSGCGKSTLLKLLLGFETPSAGQVCYDGKSIQNMDKRVLRQNLGVVLQNGKLISGSIYENITITAPTATMAEVAAVVHAVGLTEDIAQMPMGLHTVLSENSGTISGGQQQRILIARAIISNPSILIFDEATSALDNLTQAAVCESLDQMHVTRIVVAHRLSTIRNCDRILVLQDGKIAEEGDYETLMAMGGLFTRLGERQLAD